MKLFILVIYVGIITAEKQEVECDSVLVRGKIHKKHVLVSGLDRPYQLSMYRPDHKIFFSYNIGKNEEDKFQIGYITKGEKNITAIKEVTNGFASAVDQENHVVYLGGSNSIYKYHLEKKNGTMKKIITRHNIWYMFFHNKHLYFIDFPSQKLFKYETKANETKGIPVHQDHITDKIYQYVIDGEGDQFFTTDAGLYRIKAGSEERMLYSNATFFRGAAVDKNGHAYFCRHHSIYATNKKTHGLEEIVSVHNVFGITFDSHDNIIYSDDKNIVELLPGDCKFRGVTGVRANFNQELLHV